MYKNRPLKVLQRSTFGGFSRFTGQKPGTGRYQSEPALCSFLGSIRGWDKAVELQTHNKQHLEWTEIELYPTRTAG